MKSLIRWRRHKNANSSPASYTGVVDGCDCFINVYKFQGEGWCWSIRSKRASRNIIVGYTHHKTLREAKFVASKWAFIALLVKIDPHRFEGKIKHGYYDIIRGIQSVQLFVNGKPVQCGNSLFVNVSQVDPRPIEPIEPIDVLGVLECVQPEDGEQPAAIGIRGTSISAGPIIDDCIDLTNEDGGAGEDGR